MYGFLRGLKPVSAAERAYFDYVPPLFPLIAFAPVVDGSSEGVPQMPLQSLRENSAAHVPVIMVTCEGRRSPCFFFRPPSTSLCY